MVNKMVAEVITRLSSSEVTLRAYPNPVEEEVRLVWRSDSDEHVQL